MGFGFVPFFLMYIFYKFASLLGKTLGSSVKCQSSIITVVILPRSEDSEKLLSASKSAIPK